MDGGEIITLRRAAGAELEIAAADGGDGFVTGVAFQQFLAIGEKCRVRQAIVLQQNRAFDLREDPGDPAGHAGFAAEVDGGEVAGDLAIPINGGDSIAPGLTGGVLVGVAGSVSDEKKLGGTDLHNLLEDAVPPSAKFAPRRSDRRKASSRPDTERG